MTETVLVRGVLLDMDGTLVDSTPLVEAIWGEFAAAHNLDAREILSYSHGLPTISTVRRAIPDADAATQQRWCDWVEHEGLRRTEGIVEVPGAAAFIRRAQQLGLPMAIVTSAPLELARRRFAIAGVPIPEPRVTIESVERGKPHPEPFLRGAAALGLPTSELLAFEDGAAGLASATAAGAECVVVGDFAGNEARGLPRITHWDQVRVRTTRDPGRFSVAFD